MKYFIFDTETTGLLGNRALPLEKQPQVIEFYGMVIDESDDGNNWELVDELDTFFANTTGKRLDVPFTAKSPKSIATITGITDEMLKDEGAKRPTRDDIQRIQDMLDKSDAIVAHNLSFDIGMMDVEAKRLGKMFDYPKRRICTVLETMQLRGHRLNLSALHELLFGEKFAGAHRAKVDVGALGRCVRELIKRGEL